jgi:prepilin-type N-terminal cleavage/methylation domain-containing protein
MKFPKKKFTAGDGARRAEGERRTLGMPRVSRKYGTPYPEAFGVNLWNSSPAGFTLVELLTVLIIIAILAGLVVGAGKYALTKAGASRAQGEIAAMELALEHYKNDNGHYPATVLNGKRSSPSPPGIPTSIEIYNSTNLYSALSGKYFTFKPNQTRVDQASGATYVVDPFGNPYNYYCPPAGAVSPQPWTNTASFDLWSYGPNGINDEGTNDDITNWKQN